MAWLFVPGLAGSNSGSTSPNPDTELWVSLSGKHEQRPLSWRGWRTRPWVSLLSGTTSEPSTADAGVDAWISFLRASRASHSASPETSGESMMNGISGRTLPGSLARFALDGYCSKTSRVSRQLSLLMDEAPSKPSVTTFASWVTKSRGMSSQRQRWGRHIFASASLSPGDWPTPTADDMSNVSGDVNRDYQSLAATSATWPTPDAGVRTGFNRSESEGATNRPLLAEAAGMWATPAARAEKGGYSESALTRQDGKSRMDLLDNQAIHWQGDDWATPTRADADKATDRMRPDRQNALNAEAVSGFSLPGDSPNEHGEPSSRSGQTSPRRLNPLFVEWLMGWPLGWTEAGSPLPETEWSRWWQHMRGSLSALGWRI